MDPGLDAREAQHHLSPGEEQASHLGHRLAGIDEVVEPHRREGGEEPVRVQEAEDHQRVPLVGPVEERARVVDDQRDARVLVGLLEVQPGAELGDGGVDLHRGHRPIGPPQRRAHVVPGAGADDEDGARRQRVDPAVRGVVEAPPAREEGVLPLGGAEVEDHLVVVVVHRQRVPDGRLEAGDLPRLSLEQLRERCDRDAVVRRPHVVPHAGCGRQDHRHRENADHRLVGLPRGDEEQQQDEAHAEPDRRARLPEGEQGEKSDPGQASRHLVAVGAKGGWVPNRRPMYWPKATKTRAVTT